MVCKSIKSIFSLLLVFCLLGSVFIGSCFADPTIPNQTELQQLQTKLSKLQENNEKLLSLLENSNPNLLEALNLLGVSVTDLENLKTELKQSREECKALQMQLAQSQEKAAKLEQSSLKTENLLAEANKSFKEYSEGMKQKVKALEWQRNGAIVALIYYVASHHG